MQGSGLGNRGDSLQTIIKYFCWKAMSSTQAYKTAFSVSSAFNMLITQVRLGIPEQGNALHWSNVFGALAVCRKIISTLLIKTGVGMHLILSEPLPAVPDDGWQKLRWTLRSCSQPYITFTLGKPRQLEPDVLFFNSQRTILFELTNYFSLIGVRRALVHTFQSPGWALIWYEGMRWPLFLKFCDF